MWSVDKTNFQSERFLWHNHYGNTTSEMTGPRNDHTTGGKNFLVTIFDILLLNS